MSERTASRVTGQGGGSSETEKFRRKVSSLVASGYVPLMPKVAEIANGTATSEQRLNSTDCIGGSIQHAFSMFDPKQSRPVPVSGAGTKELGYIPWGPDNMLPNLIYNLEKCLPYTATALKYIIDLTAGLGPKLMYRFPRYVNGTVKTESVPFEDAGTLIRGRMRELREEIRRNGAGEDTFPTITFVQAVNGESGRPEDEPGTPEWELKKLKEDYAVWEATDREWRTFCENNNLGLHFLKCMTDDVHMDMYFPTIGLSIGRAGEDWKPKIVTLGFIPAVCARMEEMDERLRVNFVYYAEKWRKDTTAKLEVKDVVAYPALMPENMLAELRLQVEKNRNRAPRNRPTWFCCPTSYPSVDKPYYPVPAWWSIFPSRTYEYATTLITDKAVARQNATMWGKMIFVNAEYLRAMFDEQNAATPEDKDKVREEIYRKVNDFLRRRENNGKTIMLDSFLGPDGKTMQRAVEIVDVPNTTDAKELKDELEEISSIIFFAIGVHPALIGAVPGKSGSTGGTYQRELQLLKQNQLSPRQRIYLQFLKNVYAFNGWDPHGELVIRQQVLTTLDRSATGTEETESTQ